MNKREQNATDVYTMTAEAAEKLGEKLLFASKSQDVNEIKIRIDKDEIVILRSCYPIVLKR